ncbi:MAG TPA: hypothetical protein VFN51_00850 [Candidatus Saccharimonadales bacterium]|nr:hypothetical protein [Candidatus Saccharimonadales bacterium]
MKLMITIGLTIGGILFGWAGAAIFDHGNQLGGWSIMLSGVGSLLGIWAGYKAGKYYGF